MRTSTMLMPVLAAVAVGAVVTAPTAAAAPVAGDSPRLALARAYVDSLVSHNSDGVRFTPDAKRIEDGIQTGSSGAELKDGLSSNPVYRTFTGVRQYTATENGNVVHTNFLLDSTIGTFRVDENISIPADAISLLVADIRPA